MTLPTPSPDTEPEAPLPKVAPTEAEIRAEDLEKDEAAERDDAPPGEDENAAGFIKEKRP